MQIYYRTRAGLELYDRVRAIQQEWSYIMILQYSLHISQIHFSRNCIGHKKGVDPHFVVYVCLYRSNWPSFASSRIKSGILRIEVSGFEVSEIRKEHCFNSANSTM